jgi:hypothetical protein
VAQGLRPEFKPQYQKKKLKCGTGVYSSVVECMLSTHEAMGSVLNTKKIKILKCEDFDDTYATNVDILHVSVQTSLFFKLTWYNTFLSS